VSEQYTSPPLEGHDKEHLFVNKNHLGSFCNIVYPAILLRSGYFLLNNYLKKG